MPCPNGCLYGPPDLCGTEKLQSSGKYDPNAKGWCHCHCHSQVVGYEHELEIYCVDCAKSILGPLITDAPILREDADGLTCVECGGELKE